MLKHTITMIALATVGTGCSASPHMTIGEGPVVVTTTTSPTLAGGRAYWTADALILELRATDTTCGASPPAAGDVMVSITIPRALAVPGEMPVDSNIVSHDDIDVAVTELGDGLSSHTWLLGTGVLRLDEIGDARVVGGLVAAGSSADPGVNGMFTVPACGTP